jgi:Sensors of blue-light using FAD
MLGSTLRVQRLPGTDGAPPTMFDEPGFPRGAEQDDASLPLLFHVVYCSRAADGVDDAEVQRIVASSQRQNPARGITGVLVFGGGVFFQWIEGPRAEIENLMTILHRDPRHHDIVSLDQTEELRERLYPDWDMERVEADDIRDVLQDALDSAEDPANVAALNRILGQIDSGPLQLLGRA